jgi:hypothetical protein
MRFCHSPASLFKLAITFSCFIYTKFSQYNLLSKWLWQTIMRNKYLTKHTIGKVKENQRLTFMVGLIKVKQKFLMYRSFQLNNGKQIWFWEDQWLSTGSFKQHYPSLYNIVRKKSDAIEKVLSGVPLNISFWRYLTGNNLVLCHNQVQRMMAVRDQMEITSTWKVFYSLFIPCLD